MKIDFGTSRNQQCMIGGGKRSCRFMLIEPRGIPYSCREVNEQLFTFT